MAAKAARMAWYYFDRDGDDITLATNDRFQDRPVDAQPCHDDLHRPWYRNDNHCDQEHVHVCAVDYPGALSIAKELIKVRSKDN